MNLNIRRDDIRGSRRLSNYFWLITLITGGSGFLIAGVSSYLKIDLLFFTQASKIIFIPQGITMMFYGSLALTLSFYLFLTLLWDIGSGYNEFDKQKNTIRIVRRGFPGKNRQILLNYPIDSINSIKVLVREGLNPRRTIYLSTKDERQIPLTQIDQPKSLAAIEKEALELALFLDVNLETY